ncbi:MAG TPA: flagellar motor protein MotB [Bryobacteraceae bacterium]|jgi:chemotaxis protein MotB|nr:flagellar motor protein MotB [Bryobacteraceae bacterium]
MRRKPNYLRSESGVVRDRWLISYTDMVTILLILFVSIAAQGMKARIPEPPKPALPPHVDPHVDLHVDLHVDPRHTLVEAERKLKPQGLDVRLEPRGLVISLLQSVLFASGQDQVSREALPALSQIAAVLRESKNKVALVGHADTIPIHNRRFSSNWELSTARSLNLLALLTNEYGIPESRLSIQSYGSNRPLDSNDTEAGRAANRRVEILILDDPIP